MNKAETDFVAKAVNYATMKHLGQKDDEGKDYFESHLFPVLMACKCLTNDCEILSAAVLHDILEDTCVTFEELKSKFGERVANIVKEVTHDGKKDSYGFYFPRLKSKEAIMIKLIDRASNISRMNGWDEKRQIQYLNNSKFWKDGSDKK